MPETLNELQRLLQHNAAHTPAARILLALPREVRAQRPPNVPHSIVEELWHIVFWQDHFLQWARGTPLDYPARADLGWQRFDSVSDAEWQVLVSRFEGGLAEAGELAGDLGLARRTSALKEPGVQTGPLSISELLIDLAVHNAYHLGRIVQLRQMCGAWPPPGGGDTW